MEDDDDFGDLYTDLPQPLPLSSSSSSRPRHLSPPKLPPIDLKLQFHVDDSLPGPSNHFSSNTSKQSFVQAPDLKPIGDGVCTEDQMLGKDQSLVRGEKNLESDSTDFSRVRAFEKGNVNLLDGGLKILNYGVKSGVGGTDGNEKDGLPAKSVDFDDEGHDNVTFDVEEACDDLDERQLIPGLSSSKVDGSMKDEQNGEGDDWDSDSEDDLQIVLNDDTHGRMAMDGGGVLVGSEDEDGDPLVIVADGDGLNHQGMGEHGWDEDGAHAADGERNDIGDGVKGNGGMPVAPKVGYSNHGYHPFHAQFKYVRPGTAPIAGVPPMGPPGGAPGQVRPPINMGAMAGRGRGDWRPPGIKTGPMQKAFHPGFGIPPWGNGPSGRGFGGGLDFTLPSHKTIFEVDIDSFEDKPWKYPGADITDYFNFGLNEESWKDYFKQLEQLRLESTMQSKIRVYESGRTEQDYDPDMPPELAAATSVNDGSLERTNLANTDARQIDLSKASAPVRPPLMMTGRPIPVESGYGERLPSIDTRAPRNRDLDAIIEIVLQDNDCPSGEPSDPKEDLKESYLEVDAAQVETEYSNDHPNSYNVRNRELVRRRAPFMNSDHDNTDNGDGVLNYPASVNPDSRGQSPVHPPSNYASPNKERRRQGRQDGRSPQRTVSHSSRDKYNDNKREKSLDDSFDEQHSPLLSSPATDIAANEPSFEQIDVVRNELVVADGNSEMEADEMPPSKISTANNSAYSQKKQKVSSRLDHNEIQEDGVGDESKAARSSGNSKVRPASNSDFQKTRESVVKDDVDRSYNKRHLDEDEQNFRRRDRDGRPDIERKRLLVKGREDSYPYRDWDPNSSNSLFMKNEGFDRRKERDGSVGVRQRRFEDPQGRPIRTDDSRKRDFGDEMGSRHWGKGRDSDRSDKDEYLHLRKPLDNGKWKERDDTLKGRYENMDDYYSKRRKDDEHMRRDYGEKEEILLGHREIITHRKREREAIMDHQRRGGQTRIRDNLDDHHSVRKKEEIWLQRERGEKQRDERHIHKQSHEESLSKRERDDGRGAVKSVRGSEDKLVSHSRAKDEYRGSDKDYQTTNDTGRHGAQVKRKDRIEEKSLSHHNRGSEDIYHAANQFSNEEKRSRQEKLSTRNDPSPNVADNQRAHDKTTKDAAKKNRLSEELDYNTLSISKRNQEDHSSHRNETINAKGITRQEKEAQENSVHRQSSKVHKENAYSEDEHQDSRRGRSKLERWASHKELDFSINNKSSSSSSLKLNKEIDRHNNGGSSKLLEAAKDKHPLVVERDSGDIDMKDAGSKPVDERHLDTVEKLKKRSERFKLPMPSEKETITNKKIETEALPIVEGEVNTANTEIKQERPARKRRWVTS